MDWEVALRLPDYIHNHWPGKCFYGYKVAQLYSSFIPVGLGSDKKALLNGKWSNDDKVARFSGGWSYIFQVFEDLEIF